MQSTYCEHQNRDRSVNDEQSPRELFQRGLDRRLLSDQRSEFLAMVLHEMRTPLHCIRLSVDILRQSEVRERHRDQLLNGLEQATDQVKNLTDDLMDLCQTTHPTFQLRTQPIDLVAAVKTGVECRRGDFERKGLLLVRDSCSESIWIMADAERFELVLGNLLDNAGKYTAPGDQVVVSVTVENREAVLRVEDTGQGIAPELLPQIFDPFVRENISPGRTTQGSGIGLLLVRTLMELHGGRVEALSAGRGQGSAFVARFPIPAGGTKNQSTI
jgi:signal transduction histidine kinase